MRLTKIFLFINLFFLQGYLIRFQIGDYPTNLSELLIIANCFAFLLENFRGLKNLFKHKILNIFWALSAFSLLLFALGINEILSQIDLVRHLKFLIFGSALAFIFLETYKNEEDRERGFMVLAIGAVFFGLLSAGMNLLGIANTHDQRLIGPMDSAVYLAYYLAPFLIFFAIKAFETDDLWRKKRYSILAFVLALLLIATRSMGAIGGTFLCLGIYALLKNTKNKLPILITGIVIAIAIFFVKILPTLQTNYSSLDERGEIYQSAIAIIKEEPLTLLTGVGLSQFEAQYQQIASTTLGRPPLDLAIIQPHNHILLFLFHYGLPGLIFILALFFFSAKNLLRGRELLFTTIFLYFLIHGFIDTPWYKNDLLFIFILTASLAFPRSTLKADTQSSI